MLPRVDVRRCRKIFHKRRCCWKTVQVSCGIHTFNRKACFFTCNLPVNCGIQQKHMCLLKHFAVVVHIFFSINHIHVFSPTNQQSLGPKSNDQNPGPMFLHRKKKTRLALVEYASSHCWRGPRCSNVVSKGSHWERSSACYSPRGSGSSSFDTRKIAPLRKATRFEGVKNSAVTDSSWEFLIYIYSLVQYRSIHGVKHRKSNQYSGGHLLQKDQMGNGREVNFGFFCFFFLFFFVFGFPMCFPFFFVFSFH